MMLRRQAVLLFFCNLVSILAYNKCCDGPNIVLEHNKCSEGSLTKIKCDTSVFFMYVNYSEVSIDEIGKLKFLDTEDIIEPDEYCLTKTEKKEDIIMVCEDEDTSANIRGMNAIFSIISIIFIVLTISIYISLPQLLDIQGICLLHSITGLGFSFLILAVINLSSAIPQHHCSLLAYAMYFSFLYSFFWLNIFCFHIWRTIVNPKVLQSIKRWSLTYHLIGIIGPLLFLILLLAANYSGSSFFENIHPGIAEVKCWFKDSTATFIYFYGPISILLAINIMYFIWTTIALCRGIKQCSERKAKVHKYRLILCIKLFFIMGILWCFEVISAVFEKVVPRWFWILPDAINALQGFLIFLILVVFRKKVVRALANKKIFRSVRLPASWRYMQDDECEELEEEVNLSTVDTKGVIF